MSDVTEARSDTGSSDTETPGTGSAGTEATGTGATGTGATAAGAAGAGSPVPAGGGPAELAEEFEPTAEERSHAAALAQGPYPATQAAPDLHQPKRALIAAGELVVAVVLVLVAVWAWNRGISTLAYPLEGRDPLISTRYEGNWLGTAVAAVTVSAILLLDAVRQLVLAARTRPGKAADADV
ncbi:hypothetical protein AB0A63_36400 [Lentzea sp. NPDC042327]|uniref:hypothetical protein n=1 Tax=Lentzea sp. NPDC042327 TaxID=3154801 RepID=UPI003402988E